MTFPTTWDPLTTRLIGVIGNQDPKLLRMTVDLMERAVPFPHDLPHPEFNRIAWTALGEAIVALTIADSNRP